MASKGFVRIVLVAATAAALLAGCQRKEPLYTVKDHAVPTAARGLPAPTIEKAIMEAADARGWYVDRLTPGVLRATQKWKTHVAVVDIQYSQDVYSINRVSTVNLLEQGDMVHRNYNKMVRVLEDEIDRRLHRAGRSG